MKALVIAEHDSHQINRATLNTMTAASQCADEITLLIVGHKIAELASASSKLSGVKKVIWVDDPALQYPLAEQVAALVLEHAKAMDYILAPATSFGKDFMPRVAAKLDVAQISDVTQIVESDVFLRPMYAGNAIQKVKSLDPIKIMTVRPTSFSSCGEQAEEAPLEQRKNTDSAVRVKFVSQQLSGTDRPDLLSARVVVSGGRALQSKENFKILESLADRLGAAIGASRAAVDAGFVPNDYQVGQTGKIVAPELYIAVGISGAVQHIAGMKESKVIVAINKDPDAPIFQIATYGLVGDLFKVIPDLCDALDRVLKK